MTREEILAGMPAIATIKTIAESGLVEVKYSTLSRWCRTGKYPHAVRRGNSWRTDVRKFLDWLEGGGGGGRPQTVRRAGRPRG